MGNTPKRHIRMHEIEQSLTASEKRINRIFAAIRLKAADTPKSEFSDAVLISEIQCHLHMALVELDKAITKVQLKTTTVGLHSK